MDLFIGCPSRRSKTYLWFMDNINVITGNPKDERIKTTFCETQGLKLPWIVLTQGISYTA